LNSVKSYIYSNCKINDLTKIGILLSSKNASSKILPVVITTAPITTPRRTTPPPRR
jgi:hypothetical protein